MCVIWAALDTLRPTKEDLELSELCNSDGGGIAFYDNINGIPTPRYEKALKADNIYDIMQTVDGPLLIHFRSASVGGKNELLTHPFPITQNVELDLEGVAASGLMMHNGHWGEWNRVEKILTSLIGLQPLSGINSDSRVMAWLMGHFGIDRTLEMLPDSNRIATMTMEKIVLHNPDKWQPPKDGLWQSSSLWIARGPTSKKARGKLHHLYSSEWDDDEYGDGYADPYSRYRGLQLTEGVDLRAKMWDPIPHYTTLERERVGKELPIYTPGPKDFSIMELKQLTSGIYRKLIPRYTVTT